MSKEYVTITEEEFREFMDSLDYGFEELLDREILGNSNEVVFRSTDQITPDGNVSILVWSSIDRRTNKSRDKGADAIRTVLHLEDYGPIGGRKRTHRISTWRKNLRKKIISLADETEEYVNKCPECDTGYLVEREGQYGKFLGCTNYPLCDHTEQIEE